MHSISRSSIRLVTRVMWLLPLWFGLSGCGPVRHKTLVAPVDVVFDSLEQGATSALREPFTLVLRSREEFQEFYGRLQAGVEPPPTAPALDFSRQMVIAIGLGQRPTGGYRLEVARVHRQEGRIWVHWVEKPPAPGLPVATVLTQPYCLLTVEWSKEPVEFVGGGVTGVSRPGGSGAKR